MNLEDPQTRCGFVAIMGRPNVGKSSLLNALVGQKVSITSFRPQTTRVQVLGIKTTNDIQMVFVDTPGIHLGAKKALNHEMNKAARQALIDVNMVVFVVEALKWTAEDQHVCDLLKKLTCSILIAVNKIDLVSDKEKLLPFLKQLSEQLPAGKIVPLSARKKIQIEALDQMIMGLMPPSPFYFPPDQSVNHSEKFYVSEIVREKLMCLLEGELPYSLCVGIDSFKSEPKINHIEAMIWVEREGQKRIVIGEKGLMLREIGTRARIELERFFNKKVCLKLWVKVKESWSDDIRALHSLGHSIDAS